MKNNMELEAGKRLKLFKEYNNLTWQKLADKVGFSIHAVKQWAHDGIHEQKVTGIAKKLGFQDWVFMDEALGDESIKQILLYPEKQELFAEKLREIKSVSEESNSIKNIDISEEQDNIDDSKPDSETNDIIEDSKPEESTPEENDVIQEEDNIDDSPPNKIPRGIPYRLSSSLASRKRSVSGFRSPKKVRGVKSKINEIQYISEESNSINEEKDNIDNPPIVKSPLTSDFEKVSSMVKGIANGFHNLWDTDKK